MSDIIRLLPDYLANQIAAGEVVQRPASAVKELMENAIDAGADHVQLIVKDAGKQLIQVKDNGKGMSETDARMCFERHATSKIRQTEDLFKIRTMGFRGEAMASIAAVAQVELKTCQPDEELGTLLQIEGSQIVRQEPIAVEQGTTVIVKNLFYNVPARRNFLKSEKVELKHIIDEFQHVALAFPEVSFSMFNNDLEMYQLPAGKLSQRIVNLFGNSYREQLVPCSEETELIRVSGYIGKPEFARKTRGEQFFFVNQRYIRNNYLNHAVMEAFNSLLPEGSYPFYVLNIEIDPQRIDINVHPTKTEIKFEDDRSMYGIIYAAVRKGLGVYNVVPSLDFDMNVNADVFTQPLNNNSFGFRQDVPQKTSGNGGGSYGNTPTNRDISNQKNWERLYSFDQSNPRQWQNEDDNIPAQSAITFQSALNQGKENLPVPEEENPKPFQIHNTYIISQVKSGMMLIEQQTAHERILYEQYLESMEKHQAISQQLLFPQKLELSPADFTLVTQLDEEIHALGFSFSVFGGTTIVVNGVPADLSNVDEQSLFEGLLEQFKLNRSELKLDNKENLARALAKRSSIKNGNRLTQAEMVSLINQLFACSNSKYSPEGKSIFTVLDMAKLASLL